MEHREQAEKKNAFIWTKPWIRGYEHSGSIKGGDFVHKLRE
jgi:hypothetical protein